MLQNKYCSTYQLILILKYRCQPQNSTFHSQERDLHFETQTSPCSLVTNQSGWTLRRQILNLSDSNMLWLSVLSTLGLVCRIESEHERQNLTLFSVFLYKSSKTTKSKKFGRSSLLCRPVFGGFLSLVCVTSTAFQIWRKQRGSC